MCVQPYHWRMAWNARVCRSVCCRRAGDVSFVKQMENSHISRPPWLMRPCTNDENRKPQTNHNGCNGIRADTYMAVCGSFCQMIFRFSLGLTGDDGELDENQPVVIFHTRTQALGVAGTMTAVYFCCRSGCCRRLPGEKWQFSTIFYSEMQGIIICTNIEHKVEKLDICTRLEVHRRLESTKNADKWTSAIGAAHTVSKIKFRSSELCWDSLSANVCVSHWH